MTDDLPLVFFFRLKNGDDVVSEMVEIGEDDKESYLLVHPLKLVYMPSENPGFMQVAYMPWVSVKMCDSQEFMIDKTDVLTMAVASNSTTEYYYETLEQIERIETRKEQPEEEPLKEMFDEWADQIKRTYH